MYLLFVTIQFLFDVIRLAERVITTDAIQELHTRFDSQIMIETSKNGLYISEANTPKIFLRYLPDENNPLKTPF